MANRHTLQCKLVAKQEGLYTQYVFQNLEEPSDSWDHYLMITKCPNWQYNKDLTIGSKGFLTFEPVEAGDVYYDTSAEIKAIYKYSGYYFINFVELTEDTSDQKEFKF